MHRSPQWPPDAAAADGGVAYSIVKQPARRRDARHHPRFIGSRARHSLFAGFSFKPPRQITFQLAPPKGRAERLGVVAARSLDARAKEHAHPRLRSTSVHSRLHACAPHAVGLCGLLHVPGSVANANAPRSSELPPGHALGPSSVSPASHPCRRLGHTQSRKRQGHDVVRTNRIPHHVSKTIATHPLPARDEGTIVVLG